MIPEIDNADVATLTEWWLHPPERLVDEDGVELVLDEIAYALSQKSPDWIAFLARHAYSEDIHRRASSVYFIADKANATPETERILVDAFDSKIPRLQMIALQGFINAGLFPLTHESIGSLDASEDERIPAWGMTYLCHAFPEERATLLKDALRDKNPRLREFACDVIGDEFIRALREELAPLLKDENKRVAESANYNYYEMLDQESNK